MPDKPLLTTARLASGGFILLGLLLVTSQVAHQPLDVDENVFIASAALLARRSALIYRDFHYNHMPTQMLLFAALFKLTDHLLLAARLFSGACAAGIASTLFIAALHTFRALATRRRILFSLGVGLLLLFNPLFTDVVGKAWNHDLAVLAGLLGFLSLVRAMAGGGCRRFAFVAGACAAISVTTRLTFAPAMLGFVLLIAISPGVSMAGRIRLLLSFTCGFFIAAMPSLWVIAQSPRAAYFGNLIYPHLNTRFHVADNTDRPFTVAGRLAYIVGGLFTLPGNGIVTLGFALLTATALRLRAVRVDAAQARLLCLLAIVASLYASSFAAAPMQRQYLYAPTPFMVLGIAWAIRETHVRGKALVERPYFRQWFALMTAISVACGVNRYAAVIDLPWLSSWVPLQVHRDGQALAASVGGGLNTRVLTLYPVYPLEGGLDIYPELATGRFGLRVGPYLSDADQLAFKMPDVGDVTDWFDTRPPDALLVVWSSKALEKRFVVAAERRHFKLITLAPKRLLYVRPASSAAQDAVVRR